MRLAILNTLAMIVIPLALGAAPPTPTEEDPWAAVLAENGIAADSAGLVGYLKGTIPGEEQRKAVAALIEQLGDDDFGVRETTTKRLISMPVVPAEELEKARHSNDPEVRMRIETVITQRAAAETTSSALLAVLRTIARRKLPGTADVVLQVIAQQRQDQALIAAREALVATCRADDERLLRESVRSANPEVGAAAAMALATVLGDRARADLADMLNGPDERLRLSVAWALANRGDRACLTPLVGLLSSNDQRTRQGAFGIVRQLTRQGFGYSPFSAPASQSAAIGSWREWLKKDGETAELHFPLKPPVPEVGRTLICVYAENKVIELDTKDKIVWTLPIPGPWGCEGLPNGHRLICSYPQKTVLEYDSTGKECWKRADLPGNPISVQRLENGNTLISLSDGGKVVEVQRDGQIVWDIDLQGRPTDARRLENGRTLITLDFGKRVIEVDRAGKEVWAIHCESSPSNALRLENGNTLVTERGSNKVVEYDPKGKAVWHCDGMSNAVDIQRLEDGTTLVGDSTGVKQIDAEGKVLWRQAVGSARVRRY